MFWNLGLSMHKPLLISFLGAPGSGKTTFARRLAEQIGAVTFEQQYEQFQRGMKHA